MTDIVRVGDIVICTKDKRTWNGKQGVVKKITGSGIAYVKWPHRETTAVVNVAFLKVAQPTSG